MKLIALATLLLAPQADIPPSVQRYMQESDLRKVELHRVSLEGLPALHLVIRQYRYPSTGAMHQQGVGNPGGKSEKPWGPKQLRETLQLFVLEGSVASASALPWAKLAPAPDEVTIPIGVIDRRTWYARGPRPWLVSMAAMTGMAASPEADAEAMHALWVVDEGTSSRNTAIAYVQRQGDRMVPLLELALQGKEDPEPGTMALARLRGDAATDLLMQYAHTRAGQQALVYPPVRPRAKAIYLEMLKERLWVRVAEYAADEGWTDALPDVRRHLEASRRAYEIYPLLLAERSLSGRPVPQAALEAMERLYRVDDAYRREDYRPGEDIATIAALADKEVVAWMGYRLWAMVSKATTSMSQKAGLTLLKAVPREQIERILSRLEPHEAEPLRKVFGG